MNIQDTIINMLNKVKCPNISATVEEVIEKFSFDKKNPYRDEEFAEYVDYIKKNDGIVQLKLKDVLPEFTQSKAGEFFSKKYKKIEFNITRKGLHGKEHASRVALLAMIIANKYGLFQNDSEDRVKEILSTAGMYHDIGRILDVGPHGSRGAQKIEKMELLYLDGSPYTDIDRKIVCALVDSHEGKPDKIDEMVKKYKITSLEDIELAKKLNTVVRDADALDRARGDWNIIKYKVDLKPQYLVNRVSKQLLIMAYELEALTNSIKNMDEILNYKTDRLVGKKEVILENTLEQYVVKIPQISMLEVAQKQKIKMKNLNNNRDDKSFE